MVSGQGLKSDAFQEDLVVFSNVDSPGAKAANSSPFQVQPEIHIVLLHRANFDASMLHSEHRCQQ